MNLAKPFGPRDKAAGIDGDAGFSGVVDRLPPSLLDPTQLAAAQNVLLGWGDVRHRWAAVQQVWGHPSQFGGGAPLAVSRWWEPATGQEALVVLTAGARADGGEGHAWFLTPGGVPPVEIPLNGHDVWGPARLIASPFALILTRFGSLRHYFVAADVDVGASLVTLHTTPQVFNGDKVMLRNAGDVNLAPLQPDTAYWVKVSGNTIQFYADQGLTALVSPTAVAAGRWYIERASEHPGVIGNGALPLVLQSSYDVTNDRVTTAWDTGWASVQSAVNASITSGASLWLAPNHGFAAGQAVKVGAAVGTAFNTSTIYYVEPADAHHLYLHALPQTAMLADTPSRIAADATSAANTLRPSSYSGQPIVPLTEGIVFMNRLIGLAGGTNVAISDPGDFLHFTPFTSALTVALGNGDPLTAVMPHGEQNLLLASATHMLGISNLASTDSTTWQLLELSRAVGCVAPLSVVKAGWYTYWLSRAGVFYAFQTIWGRQRMGALPLSYALARKFAEIDWAHADQACAVYFDNHYLLAVPLKGQTGPVVNNCVFSFDFIARAKVGAEMDETTPPDQFGSWEGWWDGALWQPVQFALLTIAGRETLAWVNSDGGVCYADPDGHADLSCATPDGGTTWAYSATAIPMRAWLRGYTAGTPRLKTFNVVELVLDTLAANWSLTILREGVNENAVYRQNVTADGTQYTIHAAPSYVNDRGVPVGDAQAPFRQDYSVQVDARGGTDLLALGQYFEAHQTLPPQRIPISDQSRSLQLLFENLSGSARLRSVYVEAVAEAN